jgi:hypothetical protein
VGEQDVEGRRQDWERLFGETVGVGAGRKQTGLWWRGRLDTKGTPLTFDVRSRAF